MKAITIVACVLAICAPTASSAQLLQNPGFEELDGNASKVWTAGGGSEVVVDPDTAHSGRRYAKARFDDALAQSIAIDGGAAYRISGWIRRARAGGVEVPKIKVYFLDVDAHRADVQAAEFDGVEADRWLRWETVVQAPLGAKTMNLTLRAMFGGSEWFYYDDLSVQQVEAISWPSPEATPNLHGLTVSVPDISDVWSDALLRIPPGSLLPIDGQLDSSMLSRGEDIRIEFERTEQVCWALVHSMRPEMNLGQARLFLTEGATPAAGTRRLLAQSKPKRELVTSIRFDSTPGGRFVLEMPADTETRINEIQLLGLGSDVQLPGDPVKMTIAQADPPEAIKQDVASAFAAKEHRASAVASLSPGANADPAGSLQLPAEQYLNLFATPRKEKYGLAGFKLDLVLPGAKNDAMIEITLRRPEELDVDVRWATYTDRGIKPTTNRRKYATVVRVVGRVENERLSVTFDVPDVVYPAGEPIWLTLRPRQDMTLDLARSRVVPNVLAPDYANAEYVPQLARLMRRMYSDASEAHAYDGRDWEPMVLGRYVRRVLEIDPQNRPATYVYRRIAKVREHVELERPGPPNAPDWAVWARQALVNRHQIITWWLDNRQQKNGELAGHINDDGEFSCNWPSQFLITGEERIADALRKLADVAWQMSAETGYTVGSRDVEHAAEDQSCTQPQVLLVDYGNPQAVERCMVMSRYLDFWTAVNNAGRRQFKSYMFTTKQIWDEPPFDVDHPYCPLAMVGTGHLLWYAESPVVAKIFFEEAESWALGCLSTEGGKPEGRIPMEIRFSDSKVDPYSPYPNNPILQKRNSLYRGGAGAYIVRYFIQGTHALSGNELCRHVVNLWTPSDEEKVKAARAMLDRFNQPVTASEGKWSPSQDETTLYDAWRVTGDQMWLVEELKEVVRQQIRNRWLLTEAEPYTDRIPLPGRDLLSRIYLGGWTSGKSHVPGHWVSWEGGGLDYAALVLDANPNHLKALVHSFHDRPRPMTMRVWRLPHGRYQVTLGIDRDGDNLPDEQIVRRQIELSRYDGAVEFTAGPGNTLVIELSLLQELDDPRTRPDLAIGPDDVTIGDTTVTVTVHNIGGSSCPASAIEVRAAGGEILGVGHTPPIEPPHNLQPATASVRIDLEENAKPAWVSLDPARKISEITEANNGVAVQAE